MQMVPVLLLLIFVSACSETTSTDDTDTEGQGITETAGPSLDPDDDGFTEADGDCAPEDATIYPGATEFCDGVDNNCDGTVDEAEAEDATDWFVDADGDGYGVDGESVFGCDPGEGYASVAGDCEDLDAQVYPDAPDPCDGEDNNCDGQIDEENKPGWNLITVDTTAGFVFEIDTTSGQATEIVPLDAQGMSLNTLDVRGDGLAMVQDANGKAIYRLNACTGELSLLGYTGAGNLCGISFGPGGELYGLDSEKNELVSIDSNAGFATTIGGLGFDLGNCGLAYDCSTDTLYGADANANRIHKIDPVTGQSVSYVETSVPFVSVGLEFDSKTGLLLASTGQQLYTVEPSSGVSEFVATMSGAYSDDLASHPVCQE